MLKKEHSGEGKWRTVGSGEVQEAEKCRKWRSVGSGEVQPTIRPKDLDRNLPNMFLETCELPAFSAICKGKRDNLETLHNYQEN